MRSADRFFQGLGIAVVVGLLGTSAFNPQSGFLIHSYVLWQIFGLTFEIGLALLFVVVILVAVISAFRRLRSRSV